MREIISMWRNVRMVLLTATVAAVFAAVLVPFKAIQILPGFVSIRPAEGLPVAFGLLFGPAGAWGVAIGNLIGDIFGGTLNPGSAFGFVANFFHAFLAYKLWGNLGLLSSGDEPMMRTPRQIAEYVVIAIVTATALAAILGWGLSLLGLFPFSVFATMVFGLDILPAVIAGPAVLYLLYPRVEEMGLLYRDLMETKAQFEKPSSRTQLAAFGVSVISIAWFVLGIAVSVGVEGIALTAALGPAVMGQSAQTIQAILGAIALLGIVGCCLLEGGLHPATGR